MLDVAGVRLLQWWQGSRGSSHVGYDADLLDLAHTISY